MYAVLDFWRPLSYSRAGHRLVLFMVYYPQNLKYVEVYADDGHEDLHNIQPKTTQVKMDGWSLSITLSWVVFIHM